MSLFRPQRVAPVPVFLHGGWRCGSTYIWSRFRQSARTTCYYEPLHEALIRCNSRKIARVTTSSWNSRHPPLDRPYRDEYRPLLGLHGVRGYREEFAVARYFPNGDGAAPEVRYLSRLLRHAERNGKTAVFGFSRSLARAGVIKQALGGYHILVRRNPGQQWLSCRSYRLTEGSAYFELCHFLILALATPDSPAGECARRLKIPRPPQVDFQSQLNFLNDALGDWNDELSYRAFTAVHLLSHAVATRQADLTIDVDRLSVDTEYRLALVAAIASRTRLEVSFDDSHVGQHDATTVGIDFEAIERDVARWLRSYGSPLEEAFAPDLAPEIA